MASGRKSVNKSFGRIATISLHDTNYPALLREIPDPPELLYVRGVGSKINVKKTIAVVGTRHPTPYGITMTKKIVTQLVHVGYTIVSGMAMGIDTVAHWAAIEAAGKTIAVLGCGIDIVAPAVNTDLYWRIINGYGAIVSEIPPGVRTDKKRFVTRNRIISGLSLGVLVTEGARKSGTLITARYAGEQGRDVFALPGPVTSKYSGAASYLLKNGAKLVESASDILEEL